MTSPIRVALIGTGGMARHHIRQMLKMQSTTRIVALCEPSEAMARQAAQIFVDAGQPPPPNHPNWQQLIAECGDELDAAFIINAYHEMTQARTMLAAIRTALKPQGRLVIVEPISDAYRSRTRIDQEDRHEIAPAFVQQDAVEAGFVVSRLEDPFTTRPSGTPEYLLVLTPAARVVR